MDMKQQNSILLVVLTISLIVLLSGCANSTPTPTTPTTPNNPINTSAANLNLANSIYANDSYLISGDTLDAAAQTATIGFTINKVVNQDGTTTIILSSSNPEYQNQTYTLQSGQKLYFIESYPADDSQENNSDRTLMDDKALITDANDNILTMPTPSPVRNNTGAFGNLTPEQRLQISQAMTAACNGKAENDSCTASTPRGTGNGTCMTRNATLTCVMQRNGNFTRPQQ